MYIAGFFKCISSQKYYYQVSLLSLDKKKFQSVTKDSRVNVLLGKKIALYMFIKFRKVENFASIIRFVVREMSLPHFQQPKITRNNNKLAESI